MKRYWPDDVLDQAIAADWLLMKSGRADEALLGLWLSGYRVDTSEAKEAWIRHLKRIQRRGQMAASRYRGGFSGLGRSSWSRQLSTKTLDSPWWRELSNSDLEFLGEFLGETVEWLQDDAERDDESYRDHVAELIIRFRLTKADKNTVYEKIEEIWSKINAASIFPVTPSIQFVESMTIQDLNSAHTSVREVACILRRGLMFDPSDDRVSAVTFPLLLMRELLGALIVKVLIHARRLAPEMPLGATISAVHDLVMSVQLPDITNKNDVNDVIPEQVRTEWEATKKKLEQLWSTASSSRSANRLRLSGPPDPTSG